MPKLQVLICSTRPGRVGPKVAKWFVEQASKHGKFEVELVDLLDMNLPVYNEPKHPILGQYEYPATKAWAEKVHSADAFVFVTPEYDYGTTPALLNALVYLFREWNYKPVGFVSYGGVSAGTRSVQMTKLTVTSLRMMPLPEAVSIPFVAKLIDKDGVFNPGDTQDKAVTTMLDELRRWTDVLKTLRA